MKCTALVLLASSLAFGQSQVKPATPTVKTSRTAATQASAKPGGTAGKSAATRVPAAKKPASELPLLHGVVKSLFAERYEDIKIGTGREAEPLKLYHVLYSGYLASTGQKFDSSSDHSVPLMKDGKPVLGADGKPEMGPPEPLVFPQGMGRLIPGFDQGFTGMRVGGKRRIFIPWQLAYGTRDIPPREGGIGIPPKSDLIFDVDLVDVADMPMQSFGSGAPPTPHPSAPPAGTAPSTPPPAGSAPQGSAPAGEPQTK